MNSQSGRLAITQQIISQCRIGRIIETGTYLGTTTEFFAGFGLPVFTVETNPEFASQARERLKQYQNVVFEHGDSVQALRSLSPTDDDRKTPTLFYLDAHWEKHLPLREEAEVAIAKFPESVLMIDDFAVPDDLDYGFDNYGVGRAINLAYMSAAKLPPTTVYFPTMPSHQETGARRGCVVMTTSAALTVILDSIPLLRRWRYSIGADGRT